MQKACDKHEIGQRYTASKEELETFRQHSQLATLNFDYIGVEALRGERLTSMLAKLILLNLPKLRLAVANRKRFETQQLIPNLLSIPLF